MKLKRPLAISALVIIAALYVATLVAAFLDSPASKNFLMAALFCTIVLPIVLYAYQMVIHLLQRHQEDSENPDDPI